jgi:hypothetical protein
MMVRIHQQFAVSRASLCIVQVRGPRPAICGFAILDQQGAASRSSTSNLQHRDSRPAIYPRHLKLLELINMDF